MYTCTCIYYIWSNILAGLGRHLEEEQREERGERYYTNSRVTILDETVPSTKTRVHTKFLKQLLLRLYGYSRQSIGHRTTSVKIVFDVAGWVTTTTI